MAKKHRENKVKGSNIAKSNSQGLSAIGDFNHRLHLFMQKVKMLNSREVIVGWADEAREQQRAIPKAQALAKNAKRKKGKGELVSNFGLIGALYERRKNVERPRKV